MNELKRLQAALWNAETAGEREHYRRLVDWQREKNEQDAHITKQIQQGLTEAYGMSVAVTVLW